MLLILAACSSSPSPETQAALSGLKGLNSKLDVGMNIADYAVALRDAKVLVDRASETDPKSQNNEIFQKIMNGHLAALKLWRCDLEDSQYLYSAKEKCRVAVYETAIFPLYLEVKNKVEPNKKTYSNGEYNYAVDNNKVIQLIWSLIEKDVNSLGTSK